MSHLKNSSRRRFLTQTSLGMLAAYTGVPGLLSAMEGMQAMPKMMPNKASVHFKADVELELYCRSNSVAILPGQPTQVQQYSAKLLKGPENTLTEIPASYLGPIIRLYKGQKVRIHLSINWRRPP